MSCRRAIAAAEAPTSRLSRTIARFCAAVHRRREQPSRPPTPAVPSPSAASETSIAIAASLVPGDIQPHKIQPNNVMLTPRLRLPINCTRFRKPDMFQFLPSVPIRLTHTPTMDSARHVPRQMWQPIFSGYLS